MSTELQRLKDYYAAHPEQASRNYAGLEDIKGLGEMLSRGARGLGQMYANLLLQVGDIGNRFLTSGDMNKALSEAVPTKNYEHGLLSEQEAQALSDNPLKFGAGVSGNLASIALGTKGGAAPYAANALQGASDVAMLPDTTAEDAVRGAVLGLQASADPIQKSMWIGRMGNLKVLPEEVRQGVKASLWYDRDNNLRMWLNEAGRVKKFPDMEQNLADIWDSPMLYDYYPQLREMKVYSDKLEDGSLGWYDAADKYMVLDYDKLRDPGFLNNVISHEVQHAIDDIERYKLPRGPEDIAKELLPSWKDKLRYQVDREFRESIDDKTMDLYGRQTGEVLARQSGDTAEKGKLVSPDVAPTRWLKLGRSGSMIDNLQLGGSSYKQPTNSALYNTFKPRSKHVIKLSQSGIRKDSR